MDLRFNDVTLLIFNSAKSMSELKPLSKEAIPAALEKAEAIRPPGNDDALLRWNTCARMIAKNKLVPEEEEKIEYPLE